MEYNPANDPICDNLKFADDFQDVAMDSDEEEEEQLSGVKEIIEMSNSQKAISSAKNMYLEMHFPSVENIIAAVSSKNPGNGNLVRPFMDVPENEHIFGKETWELIKNLTKKFTGDRFLFKITFVQFYTTIL